VRDELRCRDRARERDRGLEVERFDELDQARVVLRLIAIPADQDEPGVRVDARAVVREQRMRSSWRLCGATRPTNSSSETNAGPARHDRVIRRRVVRPPVDEDRHVRRARVAGGVELALVVLGDADGELHRRGELGKLPPPEPGVRRGVGVDAAKELGRCDVVVNEHLPRAELRELREHLVPHREVQEHEIVGPHVAEQPAVRQHLIGPGLRLDRVRVGLVAPVPQPLLQREHVVAHRVTRCQHRVELVDARHGAGVQPMTA